MIVISVVAATAPVKVAPLLFVITRLSTVVIPVTAIVPAAPESSVRSRPPLMFSPKMMLPVVVTDAPASVSVTPPVPKFASPVTPIVEAALLAASPVKSRPPSKVNVSAVASPRVTAPVLRKSTLAVKVLPVPVKLTV